MSIAVIFLSIQFVYALFTLLVWLGWYRTPLFEREPAFVPATTIAVVIVVRNEAHNLKALFDSLMLQRYPAHLFEVFLVDDFSTDSTLQVGRNIQQTSPFTIHLLELQAYVNAELADGSFKKKGIEWAISQTDAELIVTTDGDCVVPKNWLVNLAAFYQHTHAHMICGAVTFKDEKDTIFTRLQTVEFASLIGSGAATMQLGLPTMCNAANLAFARKTFEQVGGYRDTASTATGDDLFLMHKIYRFYPEGVYFLKNQESTVHTQSQKTISDFYQQRKRWASKWKLYEDWRVSALAVFIFTGNLALLLATGCAIAGYLSIQVFLLGILVRSSTEWLFLGTLLHYLKQKKLIPWILLVQLIYPVYVVFFGMAVQQKGYRWKGRKAT